MLVTITVPLFLFICILIPTGISTLGSDVDSVSARSAATLLNVSDHPPLLSVKPIGAFNKPNIISQTA